ncbi:MAG: WD40 repeat domain-containing protein [Xenococcus sp. (in: cyanobacteria)]
MTFEYSQSQLSGWRRISYFHDKNRRVSHTSWSPDGKILAAGFVDGEVICWNIESGLELVRFNNFNSPTSQLVWSSNQLRLLTIAKKNIICQWSTETGKLTQSINTKAFLLANAFYSKCCSRINATLITERLDSKKVILQSWDLNTKEILQIWEDEKWKLSLLGRSANRKFIGF